VRARAGDERVAHRLVGLEAALGVPREALGDKVDEEVVVALEDSGEALRGRTASAALRVDDRARRTGRVCSARGENERPVCEGESERKAREEDAPKKRRLRELRSTRYLSGTPMISMMHASCSCSFSPGKIG